MFKDCTVIFLADLTAGVFLLGRAACGISTWRTCLLLYVIQSMGGAFLVEQPRSSMLLWHPRMRAFTQSIPKAWQRSSLLSMPRCDPATRVFESVSVPFEVVDFVRDCPKTGANVSWHVPELI